MQSPLPQLTTILLLIHLGFGCCFHHAHACEAFCCAAPSVTAEACPCDTHQHDEVGPGLVNGTGTLADGGHDGQQHHCAGEHCTFVASQSAPEQTDEFATNLYALDAATADRATGGCRSSLDRDSDRRFSNAGSSLRTHLMLRVLLI